MQFTRLLRNPSVTVAAMGQAAAEKTALRVSCREVVFIQDTSELVMGGAKARANGYGPVGKGGRLGGLLLHPVLAMDAQDGALLGLVDLKIWNRDTGLVGPRRDRATADKESQRWIDATAQAGQVLAAATQITGVSDRESDIFEHFARCPDKVQLIVRACQNRRIKVDEDNDRLFAFVDALPEQDRFVVNIPAAPGRKARTAELAVRFSPVMLKKPKHGAAQDLPKTVSLTMVDIKETSKPESAEPVHWRLLTTHTVTNLGDARRVVDLYRMRWNIEEFFRTLKTAGFNIEDADIEDPKPMINLVAAATVAAVTVMQLVKARDGTTDQSLEDAFDPMDRPILEAVSRDLEGKTARQQNPHPKGSLAFAAWVIARLGGWTGYYGKPGPKVMRIGLQEFQGIKYGASLRIRDV
jgi:hypothetical protein